MSARSSRAVAICSFGAGLLARLPLMFTYLGVFPPVVLSLWLCLLPLWFMAIVLATRWIARRSAVWGGLLAYPLLTTASEFLFNGVSPHGSFGALGYALTGTLPLLQLASLGGLPALTFTAAFVPAVIATLILQMRRWRSIAIAGGLPLAAAVAFGVIRLHAGYDGQSRVALAAIDALQDDELAQQSRAIENADAYAALAEELAASHPDLILLPEKSLIRKADWVDIGAPLQSVADRSGIPIVGGFDETRADGSQDNVAVLYRPRQHPERYLKRRLIPGIEDEFNRGTGSLVVDDLGVAICKDLDFAPMIRDYGAQGVRLLLVPAWDFRGDSDLHARMALVRGVENGFAVARAAADGLLTVSDAFGRKLGETATTKDRPTTLTVDIGLSPVGPTLYTWIGDVFGWLTVAGAGLLIGLRWRPAGSSAAGRDRRSPARSRVLPP